MEGVPEVRYARSGPINIAYTRWGRGAHVVVYTPPLASNTELMWELPEWVRSARHAGEHTQLVMIDKRGVGLSDRVAATPSLQDRVADTLAVLDAERLGAVDLIGHSEGGAVAISLAAEHPHRVTSLVLIDTPAVGAPRTDLESLADPENPVPDERAYEDLLRSLVRGWGSARSVGLDIFAPSVAGDVRIRRWYERFERQSASPAAILGFLRSFTDIDVRPFLARVLAPTLIVHSRGDRMVHVANGRYLASAISGARYREHDGDDHVWQLSQNWREIQDEVISFVTGERPAFRTSAFAVVLFTDIVNSTVQQAALGDQRWLERLDEHDRAAHELITRQGGRIVKHLGDGLLATFSDPATAVAATCAFVSEMAAVEMPVRAGLHAGAIEVRDDGDIGGITVNIAARVQGHADSNEVVVTRTLRELLLGTPLRFVERGDRNLKGIEGAWRIYAAMLP